MVFLPKLLVQHSWDTTHTRPRCFIPFCNSGHDASVHIRLHHATRAQPLRPGRRAYGVGARGDKRPHPRTSRPPRSRWCRPPDMWRAACVRPAAGPNTTPPRCRPHPILRRHGSWCHTGRPAHRTGSCRAGHFHRRAPGRRGWSSLAAAVVQQAAVGRQGPGRRRQSRWQGQGGAGRWGRDAAAPAQTAMWLEGEWVSEPRSEVEVGEVRVKETEQETGRQWGVDLRLMSVGRCCGEDRY